MTTTEDATPVAADAPDPSDHLLLRVTTMHSVYEIDQDAGTYIRWPEHADASDFERRVPGYMNGHERPYEEIFIPRPGTGTRMTIIEPDDVHVVSTPVLSIVPIERFVP